ncbi:MAG: hypothetical protein PVF73_00985 [Bacteroidales bacterium]|jgi:hypothetical protein
MKTRVNTKKACLWGAIVLIIDMITGNLLYMNPAVMKIFQEFEGHPTIKPMEAFGGMSNWILLNASFSIIFIIILISLFVKLYESLPGNGWIKGLSFGLIVGIIKAVPEAFNQFMLFNYPTPLIIVQLVNTLLGLIIFGTLLGFFFTRFKVIEEIEG